MFTVYRVQNSRGIGPYHSFGNSEALGERLEIHRTYTGADDPWPSPWEDGVLTSRTGFDAYFFGFASMRDLRAWFSLRERKLLEDAGFHITVFRVPRKYVIVGGKQVAFQRDKSMAIDRKPMYHGGNCA